MTAAAEFFYKVPGKLGGIRPGAHSSSRLGQGQEFAAHARLFDSPDPRRLDLRASLRDVRGEWLVRTNRQRSSVRVQAVVDVSASMAFGARTRKLDVAADFVAALGYSAFRFGDSVGLCAFDQESRNDLYVPPSIGRGAGVLMADRLRQCAVRDSSMRNLQGLLELTETGFAQFARLSFIRLSLAALAAVSVARCPPARARRTRGDMGSSGDRAARPRSFARGSRCGNGPSPNLLAARDRAGSMALGSGAAGRGDRCIVRRPPWQAAVSAGWLRWRGRVALFHGEHRVRRGRLAAHGGAILLTCALSFAAARADSIPAAVVQPARAFGHVLGDVLSQRVLLERGGSPLTLAELPTLRRIDLWLERRGARVAADAQGRHWLLIDYQIINAPRSLMVIALPPLDLQVKEAAALHVEPWPLSIGPITPAEPFGQGDLQSMRPDRPASMPQREPLEHRLQ